jgi:nicotinamide-nucleotide amidase
VPQETIDLHGAVSPEVARALAEGIRARTGTSLGISITGLAGPGGVPAGPDAEKPIGLVYIGLADGRETRVKELNLTGDRDYIRWWSSQHALEFIRKALQ